MSNKEDQKQIQQNDPSNNLNRREFLLKYGSLSAALLAGLAPKSTIAGLTSLNLQGLSSGFSNANGSSPSNPGASAAAIKALTGTNTNGFYYINLGNGQGAKSVYCIMDSAVDGGGWMVLWGCASGATNSTYNFSTDRQDTTNSPIGNFYSLNYANRSGVRAISSASQSLLYSSNSNWMRINNYVWQDTTTPTSIRFQYNTSCVTSNGTSDTSICFGLTNYNQSAGGDIGITTNNDGLDHHNTSTYYNLNCGCGLACSPSGMYLYQYGQGYKVNTTLSGWSNATSDCAYTDTNDLAFCIAMK